MLRGALGGAGREGTDKDEENSETFSYFELDLIAIGNVQVQVQVRICMRNIYAAQSTLDFVLICLLEIDGRRLQVTNRKNRK
jgi:hypothetical protein